MFEVYALYSEAYDKIYIGYSSDADTRLKYHNEIAKKGYTIKFRPWKIVHREQFETKSEAMHREQQLKSYQGRQFIRSIIKLKI